MSKLFNRGKIRFQSAQANWNHRLEDDAFVDAACFDLQQAIEFILKYLVEMQGEAFIRNHDLNAQLNKLARLGIWAPVLEKIKSKAYIFNSWETETRYKDNFVALNSDVIEAFEICEELIQFVEEFCATHTTVDKLNCFDDVEC